MNTTALGELKKHLRPGKTYRRAELAQWSKSVDRHLQTLVDEGSLKKLRTSLYYAPFSRMIASSLRLRTPTMP